MKCAVIIMMTASAHASETSNAESQIPRDDLKILASQFVGKMGQGFKKADRYMQGRQSEEDRLKKSFSSIPDGEPLILGVRHNKLPLKKEMVAIKQGDDVMVSLADFVAAGDFAIDIDQIEGTAKGWFIRENQIFDLDIKSNRVTVKDKVYEIAAGEIDNSDGEIMVKGEALERWFDLQLLTNVGQQVVTVKPAQKWPAQEKFDRAERAKKGGNYHQKPPSQPLQDDPYKLIAPPYVDVFVERDHKRPADGPVKNSQKHIIQSVGDIAGHTNRTVITGNEMSNVTNLRTTFSRSSADPELLGPLKARNYELVDINSVYVPYAAPASGEMGVHITNKDPYSTYNTMTEIRGEATPGWEVELYRDDQYLALVTVDDDGRYLFEDVDLFSGDNNFKVIQYGPQGEVREEDRSISVVPNLYGVGGGAYDVSASLQNTQTYQKIPSEDVDKDTPRIAATYAHQLTPHLALQGGFQSLQQNQENKFYVQTGAVATAGNAIFNAYNVVDDDGAWTGVLAARKKFGKHSLSASAIYDSEDYSPSDNLPRLSQYKINSAARGPLPNLIGDKSSYSADNSYLERSDGSTVTDKNLNLTTKISKMLFGNSIRDKVVKSPEGETRENTDGTFSARGGAWGIGWRAAVNYSIYPEKAIDSYLLELKKQLSPKWSGDLSLLNEPDTDFSKAELGLSWAGDHATISPTITYDTDNNLDTKVAVRFGLASDPHSSDIRMTGRNVTNKGGVSAKVFLDRDGDNIYGSGDEYLEGITVEAVHVRKYADTNERGEAFIYDLPVGILTDVVVQEGSMFDPTWVPGSAGISVRPRPGYVTPVEFPIHMGGEIDGTIFASTSMGQPRALKNIKLGLFDNQGRVVKKATTAYDGFYLMERIPPGDYLLIVDGKDAKNNRVARPEPEKIRIGYDGTVIYGHNIVMNPDDGSDYIIQASPENTYTALYPGFDVSELDGRKYVMNLGEYKSNLLMALIWYKISTRYHQIVGSTERMTPLVKSIQDSETGKHVLRASAPVGDTYDMVRSRCRALVARKLSCVVEILPQSLEGEGAVKQQAQLLVDQSGG